MDGAFRGVLIAPLRESPVYPSIRAIFLMIRSTYHDPVACAVDREPPGEEVVGKAGNDTADHGNDVIDLIRFATTFRSHSIWSGNRSGILMLT